ncbi:MAG TPA: amino acid ABC transporter permease [Clostridia bacterium]|nr:amino acid ABC transporter permease [Clostridia bacterium]
MMVGFFSFLVKYLPVLLEGTIMTLQLTVLSITFGTIIGLFVALAKISKSKFLSIPASLYTWVIRGVPLLVQLFFLYFGLPQVGIELSPFSAAVIGLSVCSGAYIAEIIRAGIQSIDKGQLEAAYSLGMSYAQAMRRIIIPQAYRRLIPPMGNEFISMLKNSSLVTTIAMVELMRTATHISSSTFRPLESFVAAGLLYLVLTTIFVLIFGRLERRLTVYE